MITKKLGIIFAAIFISMALLAWLFIESSKPLPGEKALQPGRDHKDGTKLTFQFNPPTSGDHFSSWIIKGFYEEPRDDGNLVHSMEHGYVIIWYDCEKKAASLMKTVYAHEDVATLSAQLNTKSQSSMTAGSAGIPTAHFESMPKSFSDGSCDKLKNTLKEVVKQNGDHKLIVMPRVGMDSSIILTAWGRREKLGSVDKNKIKEFINAFRDAGPEQTNEP